MKHILFDLSAMQPTDGKYHGGAEYALALLRVLIPTSEGYADLSFVALKGKVLDESRIQFALYNRSIVWLETRAEIANHARNCGTDLFYTALPYLYGDYSFDKIDLAITIHGLRQLEMPADQHEWRYATCYTDVLTCIAKKLFPWIHRRKHVKRLHQLIHISCRSLLITVPSLHTKNSLMSYCPSIKKEQIFICPSPLRNEKPDPVVTAEQFYSEIGVLANQYVLMVSCNRWIKNAFRGIRALDRLISMGLLDVKVILSGINANHHILKGLRCPGNFVAVGYVSPSCLEALYRDAMCLLYPTLNEGYGYPPLEAMKYGTPILASESEAVQEVCMEYPEYFNSTDVESIMKTVIFWHDKNGRKSIPSAKLVRYYNTILKESDQYLSILCRKLTNPIGDEK